MNRQRSGLRLEPFEGRHGPALLGHVGGIFTPVSGLVMG
jgi:hypothetical protein